MVWHFIGVYIINRILHGRLEIRNFSSRVEKKISILEEKFHISVQPCNILYVYHSKALHNQHVHNKPPSYLSQDASLLADLTSFKHPGYRTLTIQSKLTGHTSSAKEAMCFKENSTKKLQLPHSFVKLFYHLPLLCLNISGWFFVHVTRIFLKRKKNGRNLGTQGIVILNECYIKYLVCCYLESNALKTWVAVFGWQINYEKPMKSRLIVSC